MIFIFYKFKECFSGLHLPVRFEIQKMDKELDNLINFLSLLFENQSEQYVFDVLTVIYSPPIRKITSKDKNEALYFLVLFEKFLTEWLKENLSEQKFMNMLSRWD